MFETIKIREDSGKICTVGQLGKNTFWKRVVKSEHFHKKMQAWGIDAEVFGVVEMECLYIKILDTETDTLYVTTPYQWRLLGKYLHFKPHRAQIFLNIKHFEITNNYMKNKQRQ